MTKEADIEKRKLKTFEFSKTNQEWCRLVWGKYVEEASKGPDDVMGLMTVTWLVKWREGA